MPTKVKPWTVVLLYPYYMASDHGSETAVQWVDAPTATEAVAEARKRMRKKYVSLLDPTDMYLIAVFKGHHKDHSNGEGKIL